MQGQQGQAYEQQAGRVENSTDRRSGGIDNERDSKNNGRNNGKQSRILSVSRHRPRDGGKGMIGRAQEAGTCCLSRGVRGTPHGDAEVHPDQAARFYPVISSLIGHAR